MSFEYLADPAQGPRWSGLLPGQPAPFFLQNGEGEHQLLPRHDLARGLARPAPAGWR